MKQTLAQKILQKHTDEEITADGQIVNCRLDLVLANDITGPLAIKGFKAMGATKVFDKDKVALVMDHFTPQKDIASANQVMISRRFAAEQNITHYYEGGNCGVEHTLLPEQGLVAPGDLVMAQTHIPAPTAASAPSPRAWAPRISLLAWPSAKPGSRFLRPSA